MRDRQTIRMEDLSDAATAVIRTRLEGEGGREHETRKKGIISRILCTVRVSVKTPASRSDEDAGEGDVKSLYQGRCHERRDGAKIAVPLPGRRRRERMGGDQVTSKGDIQEEYGVEQEVGLWVGVEENRRAGRGMGSLVGEMRLWKLAVTTNDGGPQRAAMRESGGEDGSGGERTEEHGAERRKKADAWGWLGSTEEGLSGVALLQFESA
ncbi:hypothetical protein B0H17DRAFT_1150201 [Mycena rosella]|uniref:Uncharacterized protein n=1 Tax=Mycena rosella TaxID=1033263 RepID=A0AAD7BV56_MYCRO|nr:hypothetical protein B0H17DRAFT_1150201 [Mycena rosella]